MQSLPNDDSINSKVAAITPPLPRKNSTSRTSQNGDNMPKTRRMNSHERSMLPGDADVFNSPGPGNSYGLQDFFVGQNNHPGLRSMTEKNFFGAHSPHATIAVNDSRSPGSYSVTQSKARTASINEFDTRHLEKDINFQYLKQVVMKFIMSREHEVSRKYNI